MPQGKPEMINVRLRSSQAYSSVNQAKRNKYFVAATHFCHRVLFRYGADIQYLSNEIPSLELESR